jgi:hypothetical protein
VFDAQLNNTAKSAKRVIVSLQSRDAQTYTGTDGFKSVCPSALRLADTV